MAAPLRIAVTGRHGQVVSALLELGPQFGHEIIALGRPELDLLVPGSILPALEAVRPDVVVSAAAYTAVDKAESDRVAAEAINHVGAQAVAEAAAGLALPIIHLSTDYVFNGNSASPYVESDVTAPLGIYGETKLAGETAVVTANDNHVILRTAWVYSPFGANFVKTMLRLAQSNDVVRVVADQCGRPSYAPEIAKSIILIAQRLIDDPSPDFRGIFHCSGAGDTTWAGFAEAIFSGLAQRGGRAVRVQPISTAEYPTPARRPVNSRLDNSKLASRFGIIMPEWRDSLSSCLDRLIEPIDRQPVRSETS
jgi:dTDP-4-dehydrorhamnose reductase